MAQPQPTPSFWNRLPQLTFVPLLVLVALMSMYTRTTQITNAVRDGELAGLLSPAPAVAEPAAPKQDKVGAQPAAKPEEKAEHAESAPEPRRAGDDVENLTTEDYQLLQQLSARRVDLDKRQEQLDQREALLQAAEKRLEDKVAQLQKSRADLEKLLGQANTQQAEQTKSLVKIYENMKPAQAAKIFEQLDMPVLLQVVHAMKEAKTAPILAAMDPAKAKAVTTELMKKQELPPAIPSVDTKPN